ncbi:uncharacterized protein A4U43_C06F8060 [Asparagus officinalis]|uniref:Uncharacterized protein n=1 Tax=Asparagus officinalis TaxID=4686 RepID=A0A5P1EQZ4_ASPOF|nr:protein SLOW GREEN 1, chloroplastic [Asparagus officinalis]ONK66440.1 uncharacterized protein A4U43_C06F8060 [Asparagus officinalis]
MASFLSPSFSLYTPIPSRTPKLGFLKCTNQTLSFRPKALSLKISCSHSPNSSLLASFSQKACILIVGSLLLMGRFNPKPALALSNAPKTSFDEKLEERKETQKEKEGDEEMYAKILERNPTDVEALKVVLYGRMRKGKMAEAVKLVERLIELEPEEVEWRLLEALCCEMMGDLGKAKKLFREILKERPLLIRALHGLALAMHKNREGAAVFEMLNKALELAHRENRVTEERNIKLLIAQMHVVKGDLEEALKLFQDLANQNPRDFRPFLCQGIVYSLLDKKNEADEQFEIYRSLIPEEYPQRGFINDVILAAKTESREKLQKDFEAEFSYKK